MPHDGGRPRSLHAAAPLIGQTVARGPDVTLASLCERVAGRMGIQVSSKTMCLEIQRLRPPRKKVALGQ